MKIWLLVLIVHSNERAIAHFDSFEQCMSSGMSVLASVKEAAPQPVEELKFTCRQAKS
jgi:hypothetical protein